MGVVGNFYTADVLSCPIIVAHLPAKNYKCSFKLAIIIVKKIYWPLFLWTQCTYHISWYTLEFRLKCVVAVLCYSECSWCWLTVILSSHC